jgi:hypothetical protein
MSQLVVQADTARAVAAFTQQPSHALLLTGPPGSGKASLAAQLAADILQIDLSALASYPYLRRIEPIDGKAIPIETVRELEHFLSLRVPGRQDINRVVIIDSSQLLSREAQNALLKTLEEPPLASLIIFTATDQNALLPTIQSRMQTITVKRPGLDALAEHFKQSGHSTARISQMQAISGGLPGLMAALLENGEHPLLPATQRARLLLQQSTFERLAGVDDLAKQHDLCRDVLFILQQMAQLRLRSATGKEFERWTTILRASYDAVSALDGNAQAKLTMTNLMLRLG